MRKKLLIVFMMVAVVIMTATGCQEKGTDIQSTDIESNKVSADNQQKTIRVGWWGNQKRNDITVAVIELYQETHPDINVEYEFSDWGGYWDKLSTQAAGGTMPDLIQHDYSRIEQYATSGQLLDLTPYVESGALDLSKISESILASGTIDGKLYGACLGTNAASMVYDKEIVEKAGVTIPLQPTFDELYDICATIYEETGVRTLWDGGMVMMTMIARSEGKMIADSLEDEDLELYEKHYGLLQKFSEAEWIVTPEILAEKNPDTVETKPIVDQTTWNDFTFSNMFIGIQQAAGRELEMVMYPKEVDAPEQPMYLKPSMFFTVAADAENKDETIEFLNWFINDVACNEILMGERGIPASSDIASAIKENVDSTELKVFNYIAEVEKVATTPEPPSPVGFSEIEAYNKTIVENVLYGEVDAKAAATGFSAEAKKILNEAK